MAKYDASVPRLPTQYEQDIVQDTLQEFAQLQIERNVFGAHWEEVAELILPTSRNTFYFGNFNWPGQKKTDRQIDATGMLALHRFAAICDSLLTPRNMTWHQLQADDPQLMKDRKVRLYFEEVNRRLFRLRYNPLANFSAQNQNNYQSLGAFGNGAMFTDAFDNTLFQGFRGLRYKAIPLGEMFFKENHQGLIDGFVRWFRLTARQAEQKWPGSLPEALWPALENRSETKFNFLHRVCPRTDYDKERLDARGKPYASYYVCIEGKCLLQEGGYYSFPVAASRYDQTPGEVYGRSPAMMVLPALKTLNAEKRVFLKQGHKAADPVLLTEDDGILGMDQRPGAVNKGGMRDGKLMVGTLPTGRIDISKEMMQMEIALINDAFLVSLFQILTEHPEMTATEVIERTNEKGILLAPTVGRQQNEYLGAMIPREIDVASQQGLLPPMPPLLREAGGDYHIEYTSPLAKAQKAQEAAGFMRSVEHTKELVAVSQDMSLLDPYNFDVATKGIMDIEGVPVSWTSTDDEIAKKRAARAKQMERQQQIQEAPARAAVIKAQATMMKAGGLQQQPQQPVQQAA